MWLLIAEKRCSANLFENFRPHLSDIFSVKMHADRYSNVNAHINAM